MKICEQLHQELIDLGGELRDAENSGDRDWIIADMQLVENKLQAHGCADT